MVRRPRPRPQVLGKYHEKDSKDELIRKEFEEMHIELSQIALKLKKIIIDLKKINTVDSHGSRKPLLQ